ncbi:hypothetical protein Golax_013142 [Gossypium laxum]|uniref:Uncharacterized protein n=1 Tax=Gossypium laxum TaxID=34288 RepID=A0A7J8ZQP0_9ROSI|nr:hypothetical protein [Gossypium laxum]
MDNHRESQVSRIRMRISKLHTSVLKRITVPSKKISSCMVSLSEVALLWILLLVYLD